MQPEILLDNIKLSTLFCLEGSYAWLRGRSLDRVIWCNANQLFLDEAGVRTLKNVCNYINDRKRLRKPDLAAGERISAEENVHLYDMLIEKLASPVYKGLAVCRQVPFLQENRTAFIALPREQQCLLLFEVLHLMQCNSVAADLTLLGGVARAGIILTSKFIQDLQIKMIFQSPTGYYRRVVDLKDFV